MLRLLFALEIHETSMLGAFGMACLHHSYHLSSSLCDRITFIVHFIFRNTKQSHRNHLVRRFPIMSIRGNAVDRSLLSFISAARGSSYHSKYFAAITVVVDMKTTSRDFKL